MDDKYKELETDNLILRKVLSTDAIDLWENIFNNFENYKYYYPLEFIKQEEYSRLVFSYKERYRRGNYFRWGIVLKETNKLVGMINLHTPDYINNKILIGYIMMNKYKNNGIATEAAQRVLRFVFEDLNMHRLEAHVVDVNIPSERILQKIGMNLESLQKETYKLYNEYLDEKVYVILEHEYKNNKKI